MKTISFKLTARHSLPEYSHFNFDNEVIEVTVNSYFDKFFWSSKLGCSKDYNSARQCILDTCSRHGVQLISLEQL